MVNFGMRCAAPCLLDVGRLRDSDPGQLLASGLETSAHLICTSYP